MLLCIAKHKKDQYLSLHATQLVVQFMVIYRLDYCNALLTGLPACAVKPLQMFQNAVAHLVFNQPKRAHVTPLFVELGATLSCPHQIQVIDASLQKCLMERLPST